MTSDVLTRSRPQRRFTPSLVAGRRLRQATATADLLDHIVDRDLELVRALPPHQRSRPADKLAALVLLAQAYRHYAAGWISRRELQRRSRAIFTQLTDLVDA